MIYAEVSGGGGLASIPLQLCEEERWWLCAVACCSLRISRYRPHWAGILASQTQQNIICLCCSYFFVNVYMLYAPKILTMPYMIYYLQYCAFTKLIFRCSDALLHPGSLATNTKYHNTDSDLARRAATGSPEF